MRPDLMGGAYVPGSGGPSSSSTTGGGGGHGMMPRTELDLSYMTGRTLVVGTPHDDDGGGSSTGGSTKDKGRGSYKCGRVRCRWVLLLLLSVRCLSWSGL